MKNDVRSNVGDNGCSNITNIKKKSLTKAQKEAVSKKIHELYEGRLRKFVSVIYGYRYLETVDEYGRIVFCGFLDGKVSYINAHFLSNGSIREVRLYMFVDDKAVRSSCDLYYHARRAIESCDGTVSKLINCGEYYRVVFKDVDVSVDDVE